MRQIVEKSPLISKESQTDLQSAAIDDMHGHFEALQSELSRA